MKNLIGTGTTTIKRGIDRKTNYLGLSTMTDLVEAAKLVLVRDGAHGFTIDRVAKQAQVTKGTLLYHFHNKNQLLTQLVDEYLFHLQSKLEDGKIIARSKDRLLDPSDLAVAGFIEWYRLFRKTDTAYTAYGLKLLALAAEESELRKKVKDWYRQLFDELRKSTCPEALDIVLLLEGLFFLRHFQLDVTKDDEIESILNKLEKQVYKTPS